MSVALITGASRGLGRALARELSARGWSLVLDARGAKALDETISSLRGGPVTAVVGDVASLDHRAALAAAVAQAGRLDLLVNNASHLGPSPQPPLADYPLDELARVYEVDVLAPVAIAQLALPWLVDSAGVLINITSDAAVEAYEGWGG
jgi:NAD(P)-dependent dehydrogenase (short-subunit alcohol dehydrogenase family)